MKRKVVATLLSACMAASLMAGCGQSSGSTAASGGASAQTGTAGTSESASGDPLDADGDGAVDNPEDVVVDENKLVLWSLFAGGDGEYFDSLIEDYNSKDPPKQVQSIQAATMPTTTTPSCRPPWWPSPGRTSASPTRPSCRSSWTRAWWSR